MNTNTAPITAQPEALRLAAWLNEGAWHSMTLGDILAAGRELRRLHALSAAAQPPAGWVPIVTDAMHAHFEAIYNGLEMSDRTSIIEGILRLAAAPEAQPRKYVMVPMEPTEEMRSKAMEMLIDSGNIYERDGQVVIETYVTRQFWATMLEAAPNPHVQIPPENVHVDSDVSKKVGNVDTSAAPKEAKVELQVWRSTDSCGEFWSWDECDQYDYDRAKPENRRIICIVSENV